MTNHERLAQVVAGWRETADAWETHLRSGAYYIPKRSGIAQPPERAKGAIENWIVWLRACARDVEQAMSAEGKTHV